MAYDGQTVIDLDITRPDGDAEPKSILDDVTKEIKRALRQTQYSWSNFQNLTGVQLNVGAVVSLGANGLLVSDVQGSFLKYVVAVEVIVPSAIGLVAREGPVPTLVSGSVTALNYVRKSSSTHAVEDMGIACTPTNVIPNGAIGFALENISSGSLGNIFLFEQTSMFPISLANHVMLLTNQTGNILNAGESVTFDPNNDVSATYNDTAGSLEPIVIAFETIPNITQGRFVKSGIVPVVVNGVVSRSHYLRKSATVKALESTGVASSDTVSPPPGSVGIALTPHTAGGVGTVQASMFGATVTMPAMGMSSITGLFAGQNTTFPSIVMDFYAYRATLINPSNNATVTLNVPSPTTGQINFHGRNGRDQSAPFNPFTWINFFYTWNGFTIATRCSVNNPGNGPNLADGETHFVFIGAVLINASGVMELVQQRDEITTYVGARAILSGGTALGETPITFGHLVPPDSPEYYVNAWGASSVAPPNTGAIHDFELRYFGGNPGHRTRLLISESLPQVVSPIQLPRMHAGFGFSATIPNTGYLAYTWSVPAGPFPDSYGAEVLITGYKNRR